MHAYQWPALTTVCTHSSSTWIVLARQVLVMNSIIFVSLNAFETVSTTGISCVFLFNIHKIWKNKLKSIFNYLRNLSPHFRLQKIRFRTAWSGNPAVSTHPSKISPIRPILLGLSDRLFRILSIQRSVISSNERDRFHTSCL